MRRQNVENIGPYTWQDYQERPDDERWEIIAGEPFAMTPSPSTRHQHVVMELGGELRTFLRSSPCDVFPAPMDLKFSDADVVQPDLLVVCDPNQNKGSHFEGSPKLLIEVLSPSTAYHDRIRKLALYDGNGVEEVWLVTPYPSSVEIFLLDGAEYRLKAGYGRDDSLESPSFPGLRIKLADVFDFPIDPNEEMYLVKEGTPGYGQR